MVALSLDLDVNEVLQVIVGYRRPIVPIEAIRARLAWETDRLEDALVLCEENGDVQSLEAPDATLVACLTPLGASRRGLQLDESSSKWVPVKTPPRNVQRHSKRLTISESDLLQRTEGRVHDLNDLASGECDPSFAVEVLEYLESRRIRLIPPKTVHTGPVWPAKGTTVVDVGEGIRDLEVIADHCPACKRGRLSTGHIRLDCVCCERWSGSQPRRRRRRDRKAAASPGTKASTIRFKPRLAKAKVTG